MFGAPTSEREGVRSYVALKMYDIQAIDVGQQGYVEFDDVGQKVRIFYEGFDRVAGCSSVLATCVSRLNVVILGKWHTSRALSSQLALLTLR